MRFTSFVAVSAVALSSALAVPAFAADKPLQFDVENADVTYCGGSEKGNYYNVVGGTMRDQLNGVATLGRATTKGTPEILERVGNNECNLGTVQADGLVGGNFSTYEVFGTMYQEYVHLICSEKSGIEGVRDLNDNTDVVIGFSSQNSGGFATWKAMGVLDNGYDKDNGPKVKFVSTKRAATKLRAGGKSGGIDCFMHVTGLGSGTIADMGERLGEDANLVPFNDHDFDDARLENGDKLYNWAKIPEGTYNSLGNASGWGNNSVDTISVGAVLIGNANFLNGEGDEDIVDAIYEAFDYGLPHIQAQMAE